MSTLVSASVGSAGHNALVLRRPAEAQQPTEARHWSRGVRTSRSLFLVDGPPAGPGAATPVVVLAVNVVPRRAESLEPPGVEPGTAFRAFGHGPVGEPYAPSGHQERGTLVDAYV